MPNGRTSYHSDSGYPSTKGAERVAMYSHFEKTKIRGLQKAVPELRPELKALEHKLIDLLLVIRDNVYHPDFLGSFSLKYVLTPLVPELMYDDLVIVDGLVASVEIARLLLVAQKISPEERGRVRKDLLGLLRVGHVGDGEGAGKAAGTGCDRLTPGRCPGVHESRRALAPRLSSPVTAVSRL